MLGTAVRNDYLAKVAEALLRAAELATGIPIDAALVSYTGFRVANGLKRIFPRPLTSGRS